MPTVKEFREYFFRHTKTTTGSTPDQEDSPVDYLVKGVKKFNRLKAGDYPSENTWKKLLESITFKLNPGDTATTSIQGIVKKATDALAKARTNNTSAQITNAVVPHQLPEVVLATDGSDVSDSNSSAGGLKLTLLTRTISGYFRRNFKLEVIVDKSIEIDGTTKKLQLIGDVTSPGNSKTYGTNSSGSRGWQDSILQSITLDSDFSVSASTTLTVIGAATNVLKANLKIGKLYRFEAVLFITPDAAGNAGIKFGLNGTATASRLIAAITYIGDAVLSILISSRRTALSSSAGSGVTTSENGVCKISGTISCSGNGDFGILFAQNVSDANPSVVKAGSYLVVEEIGIVYTP